MIDNLPRARSALLVAALSVAAVLLAGCSSGASSVSSSSAPSDALPPSAAVSSDAATPTPDASIHLRVGLSLASDWATASLAESGEGYVMSLTETSDPDRFDGRFFRREVDGAVTDQHVISLFVTSESSVEVTWPDGQVQPGSISSVGGDVTDIDLAPGCAAFLAPGGTDADCILAPESEVVVASPSSTQALPSQEEAMSYLCSVGVDELANVVDSASDPHATAVLQAALTALGYNAGEIDGRYGRATSEAVRAFQTKARLAVDAKVGPRTWTSLQAAACQLPEDPAEPGQPQQPEQPQD